MRCRVCGNRIVEGLGACPSCHTAVPAIGLTTANSAVPLVIESPNDTTIVVTDRGERVLQQSMHGQLDSLQAGALVAGVESAYRSEGTSVVPRARTIRGRVIIAEAPYSEHPDRDACKIITRILWIFLLVLSPVLFLYWLVVQVGGMPALLVFAGLFLLVRFMSPTNLYAMFRIFSVLSPAARDPGTQVPVRYFRVREEQTDAEVMVRMKGHFTLGNVGLEDLVTLSGRFRRGTLHAREGYNHRTASTIRLARSYSWVGLVLTLAFVAALLTAFYEPSMQIARAISSLGGAQ